MIGYVLRRVLASCVAGGVGLALVSMMAVPARLDVPSATQDAAVTDTRPAQGADRVSRLVEEHGCWTGEAPPDAPVPGHAVVTLPGQRPRLAHADVGFGIWLDGDPGTLHAFCP